MKKEPTETSVGPGLFSGAGKFTTTRADVDAIFDVHLPAAVAASTEPLPLVIWAHGGLVNEEGGLRIAHDQVAWWRRNRAYPLHFVCESGFWETLVQHLPGVSRGWGVDVATEASDRLVEAAVGVPGGLSWLGMKSSAARASEPDGGAAYVAGRLGAFCADHEGKIELHAVGHSAGSIFHAFFVPAARGHGAPPFETVQFLAPAIRVDTFKSTLMPRLADDVRRLTVFTMTDDNEREDNCAFIYRKSLLYLISKALEDERNTPILGLAKFLKSDPELAGFFGLHGHPGRADKPGGHISGGYPLLA